MQHSASPCAVNFTTYNLLLPQLVGKYTIPVKNRAPIVSVNARKF